MRIKSLSLFNVGPYRTKSTFNFGCDDNKNINLIGGKNGAGKTTLFKALKYCLYGAKALGYEVNNATYYKEIKNLININSILSSNTFAEVSATICLENSTNNNFYTLRRYWTIKGDKILEEIQIYQDGQLLEPEEQSDFENYMLQLIAPELFNFYFFNGEKIFETLFDKRSMNNFQNSFVKIIGLDTIDIMIDNFAKHAEEVTKNKKLAAQYIKAKDILNIIESEKIKEETKILDVQTEISELESNLIDLRKKYSRNKVLSISQKNAIQNELKAYEDLKEKNRKFLKECGNNVIPFIILKDDIRDLLAIIDSDSASITSDDLYSALNTPDIIKYLNRTVKKSPNVFISELIDKITSTNTDNYLRLSTSDKTYLSQQIENILSDERANEIEQCEELYLQYSDKIKSIKLILENNSSERNEEYYEKEIELTNKIIENQKLLERLVTKFGIIEDKYLDALTNFAKVKDLYEAELKKESVSMLSINAVKAFSSMREKIIKEKINKLKELFIMNFNNLINKKGLLSGIEVDKELAVYPYKRVKLFNDDVLNILKSSNRNLIIEQYGEDGFRKMVSMKNRNSIYVNQKILGTMSAGESQVYVIALYMSMLQLSNLNIPIIIDTPFGRIDEEHRNNLITSFIKKLNNEIIILSTNEEVVDDLYQNIKENIAEEYTIQNDFSNGTIVKNGYFEEV